METKLLRPWIVTIIVAFFTYIAYVVCGSAMPAVAKATDIALGTIRWESISVLRHSWFSVASIGVIRPIHTK